MIHRSEGDPYENLANSIVMQAVSDYRACMRRLARHPDNRQAQDEKEQLLRFFNSKWYSTLTSIPADYLLKRLDDEFSKGDSDGR